MVLADDVFTCPPGETKYFAHPSECSKFIECKNEVPTISNCPPNFYWNDKELKCDWRYNVICPVSVQFKFRFSFIEVQFGTIFLNTQGDVTDDDVTDDDFITTPTLIPPTRPWEPITNDIEIVRDCDNFDGSNIQHPLNCSLYLSCDEYGSITLACEYGLYFNELENRCDDADNVYCEVNERQ